MKPYVVRAMDRGPFKVQTTKDFSVDGALWTWIIEASGPTLDRALKHLDDLVVLICSDPEHFV